MFVFQKFTPLMIDPAFFAIIETCRATEAVDLALIEEDDEIGLRDLPTRVRELTDHQRLVCQHAVDTLNDMLDVSLIFNIYCVGVAVSTYRTHCIVTGTGG